MNSFLSNSFFFSLMIERCSLCLILVHLLSTGDDQQYFDGIYFDCCQIESFIENIFRVRDDRVELSRYLIFILFFFFYSFRRNFFFFFWFVIFEILISFRNYMNDSLRTDIFLRYTPETISCACIDLAARVLQVRKTEREEFRLIRIFCLDSFTEKSILVFDIRCSSRWSSSDYVRHSSIVSTSTSEFFCEILIEIVLNLFRNRWTNSKNSSVLFEINVMMNEKNLVLNRFNRLLFLRLNQQLATHLRQRSLSKQQQRLLKFLQRSQQQKKANRFQRSPTASRIKIHRIKKLIEHENIHGAGKILIDHLRSTFVFLLLKKIFISISVTFSTKEKSVASKSFSIAVRRVSSSKFYHFIRLN